MKKNKKYRQSREENLWNCVNKKLSKVREYITTLQDKENEDWGTKAKTHFKEQLDKASKTMSANEALEIIGYRCDHQAKLINDCWAIDTREHKASS